MKTKRLIVLILAMSIVAVFSVLRPAVSDEVIYYSLGFEEGEDVPELDLGETPDGLAKLSASMEIPLDNGITTEEAHSGKHSYKLHYLFRKRGHCYPSFYFKKPIVVTEPMYFSTYVKVPEGRTPSRYIVFSVFVEYPDDPKPVLGKLFTQPGKVSPEPTPDNPAVWKQAYIRARTLKKPVGNGWYLFSAGNLKRAMEEKAAKRGITTEGMCVFGFYFHYFGCNYGIDEVTVWFDDVKISSFNPMPVITDTTKLLAEYKKISVEMEGLKKSIDEAQRAKVETMEGSIRKLISKPDEDNPAWKETLGGTLNEYINLYHDLVFEQHVKEAEKAIKAK